MTDETDPRRLIARAIITKGALTVTPEKPIRWASGYAMPVYVDNRCLIGYADVRNAIAESFKNQILKSGKKYDAIAGVATGGIPLATTLADMLSLPLLYVRGKAKDHGNGRQVEGDIEGGMNGKNILVIEDTVSTGGSVVVAIEALRKQGAIVEDCSAVYFYDIPGRESAFSKMNPPCSFSPLITFPFLIEVAENESLMSKENIATLKEWFKSPFTWGDSMGMPKEEPNS